MVRRWRAGVAALLLVGAMAGCTSPPAERSSGGDESLPSSRWRLPVSFVANHGRWDPRASWVAAGPEVTAYFVDGGVRWAVTGDNGGWALDQILVGARAARPSASVPAPGIVSYFGDRGAPGLPTADELKLAQAWPGVDVVWAGRDGQIEATYHLAPGADPSQVRIAWQGATSVKVTREGRLAVTTPARTFEEDAPRAFQDVAGRRVPVDVAYELVGPGTYGFRLGAYDRALPLVIDPTVLLYAGFLGGIASDLGHGIAVDGAGNAYVTGATSSTDFPLTTGAFQTVKSGLEDVLVAKVNATGSALIYATFLGGFESDIGRAIAVDAAGNAYVVGETHSSNFPTVNPIQATLAGSDAFLAKVGPTGATLVYSTFLGGPGIDDAAGVAVDGAGNAYVTGTSTTFPAVNALQATNAGGLDAFVAKVNPAGSAFVYATNLGGTGRDAGLGIAVDGAGNAYVAGSTFSSTFPTANPIQAVYGLNGDAFVSKLNAAGSALLYSTFLGGSGPDDAHGIAVDGAGNAYVTGAAAGAYPRVNALQAVFGGTFDAFVTKLNAAGSALVYSTFLGGPDGDTGHGIAVDAAGNATVVGTTRSSAFPTANAPQPTFAGGSTDAFVARLNAAGSALMYSTFLGGQGNDIGEGIALDTAGSAYVTGSTNSSEASFPETSGTFQPTNHGGGDAFVAKLGEPVLATPTIATSATPSVTVGGQISDTATVTGAPGPAPAPTGTVTFTLYGPDNNTCTGPPVFTSANHPLTGGPPPTATSGPFTASAPGTYRWMAAYSGDGNYTPATSPCNATGETSIVEKATPTLATQASAGGPVGTSVHDVATVSGGSNPTGTVTFSLYSDAACTNLLFTSPTRPLVGATATSASFTPAAPGTYYWTAAYSGDANNNAVSAACGAPNEWVVITPFQAPPFTRTITGDLLGPVTVNAGESVLITNARVVGPVTVNPGGALTVVNSQISRGVTATAPSFFSLCGNQVWGPAPATALSVTGATVPIRVGDPAAGCAGNRVAGQVVLSGNLAVTFGANTVSHNATLDNNGPGSTVVKANTVFGTLGCAGNNPAPTNAGQPSTAGAKTGQCAGV